MVMDTSCDVVEIPIEAAQEYIATAIGFAPLHLSDLSTLRSPYLL